MHHTVAGDHEILCLFVLFCGNEILFRGYEILYCGYEILFLGHKIKSPKPATGYFTKWQNYMTGINQLQYVEPVFTWCYTIVFNDSPTLDQHWVNVYCLLYSYKYRNSSVSKIKNRRYKIIFAFCRVLVTNHAALHPRWFLNGKIKYIREWQNYINDHLYYIWTLKVNEPHGSKNPPKGKKITLLHVNDYFM